MFKTILAYVGGVTVGSLACVVAVMTVLKYEKNIKKGIREHALKLQKFAAK
jgi:hypothetical protein